eukprot:GHVU01039723.1.p1 GENE.GHVU01039723.1~~GHVU01039723.1.p1  ORF type:complete len:333 (-),score=80.70 GHVU01039723.1:10-1008(-)
MASGRRYRSQSWHRHIFCAVVAVAALSCCCCCCSSCCSCRSSSCCSCCSSSSSFCCCFVSYLTGAWRRRVAEAMGGEEDSESTKGGAAKSTLKPITTTTMQQHSQDPHRLATAAAKSGGRRMKNQSSGSGSRSGAAGGGAGQQGGVGDSSFAVRQAHTHMRDDSVVRICRALQLPHRGSSSCAAMVDMSAAQKKELQRHYDCKRAEMEAASLTLYGAKPNPGLNLRDCPELAELRPCLDCHAAGRLGTRAGGQGGIGCRLYCFHAAPDFDLPLPLPPSDQSQKILELSKHGRTGGREEAAKRRPNRQASQRVRPPSQSAAKPASQPATHSLT